MRVGVIGSGQMGSGIAQVCATKGLAVHLCDHDAKQLEKAKANIARSVSKLLAKATITAAEEQAGHTNITYTSSDAGLAKCELIIEAVSEDEALKKQIFTRLDKLAPATALLASNTSSIPITRLAACTQRPDKVIGMHFMNPVPLMRLVEIIPTATTSEATLHKIQTLVSTLGKESVVSQDYAGFIVNRVLMPMINEAFNALMCGIASAADIDKGMRLGTNQPLGPLALADLIGLDTCYAILQTMQHDLGDQKYHPSPLLAKYVEAGKLGRKCGQGVYSY